MLLLVSIKNVQSRKERTCQHSIRNTVLPQQRTPVDFIEILKRIMCIVCIRCQRISYLRDIHFYSSYFLYSLKITRNEPFFKMRSQTVFENPEMGSIKLRSEGDVNEIGQFTLHLCVRDSTTHTFLWELNLTTEREAF